MLESFHFSGVDDNGSEFDGKIVAAGSESGQLRLIDINSRQMIATINCLSPVNCCTFVDEHTLVSGCQNGALQNYDIRKAE